MNPDLQDFGHPAYFEPEAIGKPGNRRFRLIAATDQRTAALWLERDQLREFSMSLQHLMTQLTGEDVLRPAIEAPAPPPPPREDFPENPDVEFQVGPIILGYDEDEEAVIVLVAPVEIIEVDGNPTLNSDAEPQFRVALAHDDVDAFIQRSESVLAAGRPRCPYCGQALNRPDEPHGCVRQNGHRHLDITPSA